MALIYDATLSPTKIELLTAWVTPQPWAADVDVSTLEPVGAYRFDDPFGAVGMETHLLRTRDDRLLQVPLTYRDAPLDGADAALVGTTEHSVLGTRWVYDGCADPVYATALAATIRSGGREADLEFHESGEHRRGATRVRGSGTTDAVSPPVDHVTCTTDGARSVIRAGDLELVVLRVLPDWFMVFDAETLSGTWAGNDDPVVLAFAS